MQLLQEIRALNFDLEKTLSSGQVFHWEKCGKGFAGAIADEGFYVEQGGNFLKVRCGETRTKSPPRPLAGLVARYFALDHPLKKICASFPRDEVMDEARDYCGGLRIIRQPKWECLATFICSSMKQVAHIRQISLALRKRFGEAREIFGVQVHSFPTAQRIAESSETELRACAVGYRARNLLATARMIASGDANLENWSTLSDDELRARLCKLPGVGAKVANCVSLFAYERLRAFPIDVWIERVLREKYFARKKKKTSRKLREFAQSYFGEHGGYAQQYLFHHARMTSRRGGRRTVGATGSGDATARVPPMSKRAERNLSV